MPITRATRNRGRVRKDSKTRPGSKKIPVSVSARDNSFAGGSGCGLNGGGGGGGTKSGELMNYFSSCDRERWKGFGASRKRTDYSGQGLNTNDFTAGFQQFRTFLPSARR